MFRSRMAEDDGMLFVFKTLDKRAFWMKNTELPLTVAFLDDRGFVINLEDMQPQSLDTHWSAAPARYALEMNQGWFKKRGIDAGAKVEGLEKFNIP